MQVRTHLDEIVRKTRKRKYTDKYNCDFSVAWETDSTGSPYIIMCTNHPVRFIPEFSWAGVFVCDEHFEIKIKKLREERYAGQNTPG